MTRARKRLAAAGLAVLLLAAGVVAPAASADRQFPPDRLELEVLDSAGNPDDRAGIHPDRFVTRLISPPGEAESPQDVMIDFPPGMGGDPTAVPACARDVFEAGFSGGGCPPESQVGKLFVETASTLEFPIYNVVPAPGELAAFGVDQVILGARLRGRLRPDDYGLSMQLEGLAQETLSDPPHETRIEFWGVPADHQAGTSLPRRAFLTTPPRCDRGPLALGIHMRAWERPGELTHGTVDTGLPLRGCEDLAFDPSLRLELDTPSPDSPTGFALDLIFPENADPDGRASAQARNVSIDFPVGMALSPGVASGLDVCRDADLHLRSSERASCPSSARIGSVEIAAPQLSKPLQGQIYFGQEHPGDRFRMIVVARGEGIETKFVGSLRPDPVTGRLTTHLTDLPEISFGRLSMRFDSGPDAMFVTPLECGPATATATLTPYTGTAPVSVSSSVSIAPPGGGPCPSTAPFNPALTVGASSLRAGQPTTFSALLSRRDGEQLSDRFSLAFPPGLTASTGSVGRCPETAAASGACPAASRIGSAFVEVGSGSNLAGLDGDIYLTGPYRRAPFGFAIVFRAALGPFDLGSLVVRAALRIDPLTGRVSVQTDSLPQTFEGVPIRFRRIGLEIDRPGFMRAPTSCSPKQVEATVVSTTGATARPTSGFVPHGCVGLPFRPKVSMALTDPAELRRDGRPGLRIAVRTPKGNANLRTIKMSLPAPLRFDAGALAEICARREALAGRCPKSSRVGEAQVRTSLLAKPLKGQIYVVQPRAEGQPDLWVSLAGEGLGVDIRSSASTEDGRITTRFEDLPDMPLSAVTLRFASGKRGVMALKGGVCEKRTRALLAPASFEGQNGARRTSLVRATTPGACGEAGSSRRESAAGGRRAG